MIIIGGQQYDVRIWIKYEFKKFFFSKLDISLY